MTVHNNGHTAPHNLGTALDCVPTELLACRPEKRPITRPDLLAAEEPLEIRVRGHGIAITMRTPGHDEELAAGFLLSEGVISKRADVAGISVCSQGAGELDRNILNVFLPANVKVEMQRLTRHVFASSSCGLCGKSSIDQVRQLFPPITSSVTIRAGKLVDLPRKLLQTQQMFAKTGGLHAAAIFTKGGRLVVMREDVGRHNAVDKAIGHCFLGEPWPLDSHILLVSGRTSFEIIQKALAVRIPVVAAVSAPTSLAVEFARENGQTLVGFLRGKSFNIYSHPQRITGMR